MVMLKIKDEQVWAKMEQGSLTFHKDLPLSYFVFNSVTYKNVLAFHEEDQNSCLQTAESEE